jgi:hypothetical protein
MAAAVGARVLTGRESIVVAVRDVIMTTAGAGRARGEPTMTDCMQVVRGGRG